ANSGQSPAKNCIIRARAVLLDIIGEGESEQITGRYIFTPWVQSRSAPVSLRSPVEFWIDLGRGPDKQHHRVYDGTDFFQCEIHVEWSDVFGESQREIFFLREIGIWGWNSDNPKSRCGSLKA